MTNAQLRLIETIRAFGSAETGPNGGAEYWPVMNDFVGAAILTMRGYLKADRRPWFYVALGATLGIGGVVAIMAAMTYWRAFTYALVSAVVLAVMVRYGANFVRSELARLSKYDKGYYDHLRNHTRSNRKALKAMGGLTRQTEWIGKRIRLHTKLLQYSGSDLVREIIQFFAARDMRKCAEQFSRINVRLIAANASIIESGSGIVAYAKTVTTSPEQREVLSKALTALREASITTIGHQQQFAAVVRSAPGTSRWMNASKHELADSVDQTVSSIKRMVDYCDHAVGELNS